MARGQAPPLLPDRLVAARRAAGLTQQALAESVGVSHRTIVQYEKGRERPEIQRLSALARALDTPVADLVEDGSLPAGLARLRVGAGLTLSAAARVVRAHLPEGAGIACSRPVLADAERGVLPPTWEPPPAAGAVRTALGTAYGAGVEQVATAWQTTFGAAAADVDPAPDQTSSINGTPTEGLSETTPPVPAPLPPWMAELPVCPYSPSELAAARVKNLGDGLYEVRVDNTPQGRVRRDGPGRWSYTDLDPQTGRERTWLPVLAPSPTRAKAVEALLAIPGRLWSAPKPGLDRPTQTVSTAPPAPAPARAAQKWKPLSAWLWERLVQVAAAGPAGADDEWAGGARWQEHLATRERTRGTTGRGYVDDNTTGWYWLTEAGREHILAHRDDYADLYPHIRQPRAVREMTTTTLLRAEDPRAYSARQVWGEDRPASQRWTIKARVRVLAGGIINAAAHGVEGAPPSVRWQRDDASGGLRAPRVDEVIEVLEWTSPWRTMPEAAPNLPGAGITELADRLRVRLDAAEHPD